MAFMNVEELVYLHHCKDEDALAQLIEYYKPMVCSLLKTSFDYMESDQDGRKDYEFEAQLALLDALENYQPDKCSFTTFYRSIFRNRLIDFCKKEKRSKGPLYASVSLNGTVRESSVTYEELLDEGIDLHTQTLDKVYSQQLILELKDHLNAREYKAFLMKLEGFTRAAIGKKLHMSDKKVRVCIEKAKRELQKIDKQNHDLIN
jgi:RNA polymerase sigma factor (sigma-70 family)